MFVAWKNFHLIIEAFNGLTASGIDAELVIFGRSAVPFRKEEQEHIVTLSRSNPAIHVKDHDPQWTSQLTENDVFVHAAQDEPFGIVMLEAFASGCRCVIPAGTFLDEFPEPLRSRGIYRVQPMTVANLRQNMAAAMSTTASSRDLWTLRLATAKDFSVDQACLKLLTVYENMLPNGNFGE
jgi:glycosyltransferase involved in cell wall biosynthesis